jgi:hypothetical protein
MKNKITILVGIFFLSIMTGCKKHELRYIGSDKHSTPTDLFFSKKYPTLFKNSRLFIKSIEGGSLALNIYESSQGNFLVIVFKIKNKHIKKGLVIDPK